VTHSFKRELSARGIDEDKIDVVINGVDLSAFAPSAEKNRTLAGEFGLSGKFVVGYIGTHGLAHALDKVLDTAERLAGREEICFLLVGGGAERATIENLVVSRGLKNVVMMPRQPKENMAAVWSLCNVSLISLRDTPLFTQVIPSKIFESMGMGLPMVIACPKGEATEMLERTHSGLVVPPEDPQALAETISRLFNDQALLKELAQSSAESAQLYDRARQAGLMIASLKSATGN